jgi:hypothetical protein
MTYLFFSKAEYVLCVVSILFCYFAGSPSVLIMLLAGYMLHCFLPPSFFDLLVMEFSN